MEITNGQQLNELFLSCGMGFLLGAFYDVFRLIRLIMKPGAKAIFFQDLAYFLISAIVTFLFALAVMDGELRFYLFFGLAVGFAAYYFTIGRVVMRCGEAAVAAFLKAWHFLWWLIFWPFRFLFRLLRRPLAFLKKIFLFLPEKFLSFLKKGLKRTRSLLYNQKKKRTNVDGEESERD